MILQVFRTNLRGVSFIDVLSLPMKNYPYKRKLQAFRQS